MKVFWGFLKKERGRELIEFGVIIGIIAIILISIFIVLGPKIKDLFIGPGEEKHIEERTDITQGEEQL